MGEVDGGGLRVRRQALTGVRRLALSAILATAFIACIWMLRGIVYDTVDDYNVMMTLAGDKTGEPYWQTTFYNPLLSWLITRAYLLTDSIQWYSWIGLAMLWVGLVAIADSALKRAASTSLRGWQIACLLVALVAAMALYPVQRMQFSTTSAMIGAGAAALAFSVDPDDKKEVIVRRLATSLALLVLSYLERGFVGYVTIGFWAAGLFRLYLLELPERREAAHRLLPSSRVALPLVLGVALVVILGSVTGLVKSMGANRDYFEYDTVRSAFQDFPHPTYAEGEEMYREAGWSEEVYRMASSLLYLAPEINEESFTTIADSEETRSSVSPAEAAALLRDLLRENLAGVGVTLALAALCVASIGLGISLWGRTPAALRRRLVVGIVGVAGVSLVAAGMVVYLCLWGRLLLRVYLSALIAPTACLFLQFLDICALGATVGSHDERAAGSVGRLGDGRLPSRETVFTTALVACLLASSWLCARQLESLKNRDSWSPRQVKLAEEYAIEHPGQFFVHDYSFTNSYNSYDPFRVYAPEKPSNLMISGGSYTYTGCYYEQLRVNGFDSFSADDLLEGGAYMISDASYPGYVTNVENYLESKHGPVKVTEVDRITDSLRVYGFSLEDA